MKWQPAKKSYPIILYSIGSWYVATSPIPDKIVYKSLGILHRAYLTIGRIKRALYVNEI